MPDPITEVIACPACRHTVRVPTDWLGQTVQCPECRAAFTAPVRQNGRLTDPVLLSAPAAAPAARRDGPSALAPGIGLVLVGIASLVLNGMMFAQFLGGADAGKEWLKERLPTVRRAGLLPPDAGDPAADDKVAAEFAPKVFWVWPLAMALAALTTAGGVSLVRGRNPRLARLGCAAAAVNLPGGCCFPGAGLGLWGLYRLHGDDEFGPPREPPA
ncbi:MAG TPA: hypothetical protein VH092_22480 [Urbifossiella sp.]|jgi:hypothetical protein|nr:hypothetical protein [Urbifossiella sp.]